MSTVTTATATATATVLAASPQTSVSQAVVFSRHAVHAALLLVVDFFCLAVLYAAQDAPFLAAVQVIVYTGAIMILFLFVLMLVGVDSSDSLVETLRGQRVAAAALALGFVVLLIGAIGSATLQMPSQGLAAARNGASWAAYSTARQKKSTTSSSAACTACRLNTIASAAAIATGATIQNTTASDTDVCGDAASTVAVAVVTVLMPALRRRQWPGRRGPSRSRSRPRRSSPGQCRAASGAAAAPCPAPAGQAACPWCRSGRAGSRPPARSRWSSSANGSGRPRCTARRRCSASS